jgi:acyl-CoA dehydrogenase
LSVLYDESQQLIASAARRALETCADTGRLLALLEQTGRCDEIFRDRVVAQGWTALSVPQAHGGLGLGLLDMGIIAEATGRATAGAPILTTTYGAVQALLGSTDAALAARWLGPLATGEANAAIAFGEGQSPMPRHPATLFKDSRLTGCKLAVLGGLFADFAVVWARRGDEPVLVLAETGNLRRDAIDSFDNSRGYADIHFENSPARLLVAGAAARDLALATLAKMAVVAAHEQLGGAQELLTRARDYALTRRAFGQPIGAFQSVKHRLAELYALVEIARANCIHAAASEGAAAFRPDFLKAAAAARLSATEAYDTAARDGVQIHGGIGVTWQLGLHLHLRRARSLAIEQGNAMFWEDLLVRELTEVPA